MQIYNCFCCIFISLIIVGATEFIAAVHLLYTVLSFYTCQSGQFLKFNENILQLQLSCKWSRNCCSCKLHMLSVGILTYTAALAIHTSPGTSSGSMHIADLCFALHQLTLAVAVFIFHGKHMLSCASGRGVHVKNNVVLTKWRIALSITLECLRTTEECIECYDHDK